jgi:hypothetical protein
MMNVDIASIKENQQRSWFIIDLTAPDKAPQMVNWILKNAQQVDTLDVHVSARIFPMRIYLYDSDG